MLNTLPYNKEDKVGIFKRQFFNIGIKTHFIGNQKKEVLRVILYKYFHKSDFQVFCLKSKDGSA